MGIPRNGSRWKFLLAVLCATATSWFAGGGSIASTLQFGDVFRTPYTEIDLNGDGSPDYFRRLDENGRTVWYLRKRSSPQGVGIVGVGVSVTPGSLAKGGAIRSTEANSVPFSLNGNGVPGPKRKAPPEPNRPGGPATRHSRHSLSARRHALVTPMHDRHSGRRGQILLGRKGIGPAVGGLVPYV